MDFNKFIKKRFEHRTEFVEVSGLYEFIEMSDELKAFIESEDFNGNAIVKVLRAQKIHDISILKRLVENGSCPDLDIPEEVKDLKAGFEVRGLSGKEYAKINADQNKEFQDLALELIGAVSGGRAEAAKKYLTHGETGKRIMLFEAAVVWPEMGADKRLEIAAKMNEVFPLDFINITNKIVALTGLGQCPEGSQGRSSEIRE